MFRIHGVDVLGESDCETIGTGALAQPANALSSLAFLAAGGWLARRLARSGTPSPAGLAFAGLLAANGIGSFVYHGPQPTGGEVIHDLPALGVLGMAVAVTAERVRRHSEVFPGRRPGRIAVAAGAFAVGGVANLVGRTGGIACAPDSIWQPHSLWHLTTAAGLAALGLLYFAAPPDPAEPGTDTAAAGS